MISAEIFPSRNIRHRLLFRDIRQAMHLYGLVIIQISAEPFTHAPIKADGWIEVEQLMRKEIDFLANVKICPAGMPMTDKEADHKTSHKDSLRPAIPRY